MMPQVSYGGFRRRRPRRRKPTGYAVGGTVTADQGASAASSAAGGTNVNNPVMISAALDARSKNPAHYAEDAPLLATRPAGAPAVPEENTGYARGGEVKRQSQQRQGPRGDNESKYIRKWTKGPKTGYLKNVSYFPVGYENRGYQSGGEVDDDETVQEAQPEPVTEEEEELPPEPSPELPPQPPPDQPPEPAPELPPQPPPDQPPERELSRQTGYQTQPPPEQPPEPPPRQTGYDQQPADDQSVLSRALDWLHDKFGFGGAKTSDEPSATRRVREALGNAIGLHGQQARADAYQRAVGPAQEPGERQLTPPPAAPGFDRPTLTGAKAGQEAYAQEPAPAPAGDRWIDRPYGLPKIIRDASEQGLRTEELRQAGETAALGQIGRGIHQTARNVGGFFSGIEPQELPPAAPPKLDPSYLTSSAAAPPAAPATAGAGGTAATPATTGAGGITPEQQAIRDYMSGKGGYTPMQMTEIINRATKGDQTFDVGGAIFKGFQSLQTDEEKGQFLQALKPSYENVFAAMTAFARQGKYVEAMQLAEKLDNLIPNGNNLKFTSDNKGAIVATVQSNSGARTFVMTPQQFQAYTEASGPLAAYDLAAKRGTEENLLAVGARQAGGTATGYAAGGQQPAGVASGGQQPLDARNLVPFRQGQPLGSAEVSQFTRPLAPGERREEPNFLPGGPTGRAGQQVPGGTIAPRPGEPGFVYPQDRANWDKLPPAQQDYNIKHLAYNQFPNDAAKQQQAEARIRQQIQLQKNTETYRSSTAERAENRALTREKFNALTDYRNDRMLAQMIGQTRAERVREIAAARRADPEYKLTHDEAQFMQSVHDIANNTGGFYDRISGRVQQPNAAPPTGPAATATTGQTIRQPTPSRDAVDLNTYKGTTPPPGWTIPQGWAWGRSKSTGIWSARPAQ